ncbi:alpha/beta hydrolase [Azotobacter chroococcum]|uniref:Alpha/beta hydrolase n=1 Tax=Azotobacter chroococcum TaxID=353 RepID=A0AA43Z317_9GAMM|nr:alpha/beta fold hydrolase [Azotobacter chroococcum]NHN76000.1 alpha/beta hydrolase [Azotobacter chroococcum]
MTLHFEEVRLNLPHIELAAHLYGPEDGLPVIALHGWLDNAMSFARLAPRLAGLRIVALDFAGHGHSAHRPAGLGYSHWEHAFDVLQVAEQFGWQRFSLLGHSMGGIVAVLLAGALPERVERLALIDGGMPITREAAEAPLQLGDALRGHLALAGKRKPVYESIERAVQARMHGVAALSREAAERLAERGLMPVPGGYTWRADSRLRLPYALRLDPAQAEAFLRAVRCPVSLVLARQGLLAGRPPVAALLKELSFEVHELPGGHHLHLDDEAGARAVADCFKAFFPVP